MSSATLGKVKVGYGQPVRIMGVINMSPESFFSGSVCRTPQEAVTRARSMVQQGADLIDVGGMSTAPYRKTEVSIEEEAQRVAPAIRLIKKEVGCTVSVDTFRSAVAEAAFRAGADVLNDVSGFKGDPRCSSIAREHSAAVVLMARESKPTRGPPVARVRAALSESIGLAEAASIPLERIVLDPGIGFFRDKGISWYQWDSQVLSGLERLAALGRPLLVGVSRKSFIGAFTGSKRPEERLLGSLAAEAVAVAYGADVIRTHNVAETYQAVRVAEKIRRRTRAKSSDG